MASHIFQQKHDFFLNLFHYVHHFIHSYFLNILTYLSTFQSYDLTLESFSNLPKLIAWGCYLHHDAWELKVPTKQSPQRGVGSWKYIPSWVSDHISPTKAAILSWWFSEFPVWWDRFPGSPGGQRLGSTKNVMTWLHESAPLTAAAIGKQRCCFRATSPQMIPVRAIGCWTGSRFDKDIK